MPLFLSCLLAYNKNLAGLSMNESNNQEENKGQPAEELGENQVLKNLLLVSSSEGDMKMVTPLIDVFHVDKDTRTINGETSLHLAAANGHMDVVKYLIEKLCDKNARANDDLTPLHYAASCGKLDIVKYLIEEVGVQMDVYHKLGGAPIHEAAQKGQLPVVQYFVERHNILDLPGKILGRNPVDSAILGDQLDVIKYLFSRGSNKEFKDKNLKTPLHTAAEDGKLNIVKYLVEIAQTQTDPIDKLGNLPIDLAEENKHKEVVEYLLKKYPLLIFKSPTQRKKIQEQLEKTLSDASVQNNLNQCWESLGVDSKKINMQNFIKSVMYHMEKISDGKTFCIDPLLYNNPKIRPKVDESLEAISKEIKNQAIKATGDTKEALDKFDVEYLRPYITLLVKRVEDKIEIDKEIKEVYEPKMKEIEESTKRLVDDIEEGAKEMENKDKERDKTLAYFNSLREGEIIIPKERTAVPVFSKESMPSYRLYLIKNSKKKENYLSTSSGVNGMRFILIGDNKIISKMKPIYRDIISYSKKRRADKIDNANKLIKFSKEQIELSELVEQYPKDAKIIMKGLKESKKTVIDLLKKHSNPLQKSTIDLYGYDSDFENDYSSSDLQDYIDFVLGISQSTKKTLKMFKAAFKTKHGYDNFKHWILSFEKSKRVQLFSLEIKKAFKKAGIKKLIKCVGNNKNVAKSTFVNLFMKYPDLKDCILSYPGIKNVSDIEMSNNILLETIIESMPSPIGRNLKTNKFNRIKINLHRLAMASKSTISMIIKNRPLCIESYERIYETRIYNNLRKGILK